MIWPTNRYWDVDVENERSRIAQLSMKEKRYGGDLVTLDKLAKAYTVPCYCRRTSPLAVAGLTVGIPRGECFGLLGVNGSGKTTTFKILTAELLPTFGTAYIAGHCVTKESKKVYTPMGMCGYIDIHVSHVVLQWRLSRLGFVDRIHFALTYRMVTLYVTIQITFLTNNNNICIGIHSVA